MNNAKQSFTFRQVRFFFFLSAGFFLLLLLLLLNGLDQGISGGMFVYLTIQAIF
ncbi:hypothetical protein JCM19046_2658 [Bacillus sp. JCM 19046]|nr:hypothetical protein JCM19046_2658 [Bacillus sp. JCM 19046]